MLSLNVAAVDANKSATIIRSSQIIMMICSSVFRMCIAHCTACVSYLETTYVLIKLDVDCGADDDDDSQSITCVCVCGCSQTKRCAANNE